MPAGIWRPGTSLPEIQQSAIAAGPKLELCTFSLPCLPESCPPDMGAAYTLGLLALVLGRYSGENQIVLRSEFLHQMGELSERPVSIDLSDDVPFSQLVATVHAALSAPGPQHERHSEHELLATTVTHRFRADYEASSSLPLHQAHQPSQPKARLDVYFQCVKDELVLQTTYDTDIYDRLFVTRLASHLWVALENLRHTPMPHALKCQLTVRPRADITLAVGYR